MFEIKAKRSVARRSPKRYSYRRGAAMVEAAVILPILMAVSVGSTDVAQYINLAQTVSNASRQGARIACRDTTENVQEVEDAIRDFFVQTFPRASEETLTSAVDISVCRTDGTCLNASDLATVQSGNSVIIEVEFDFDSVRWFKGFDYFGSKVRTSATIGRRE